MCSQNLVDSVPNIGGHGNKGHVSESLLQHFKSLGCKSLIDIGCGAGHNVALAREKYGYDAYGIEGDPDVFHNPLSANIFKHDFEQDGKFVSNDVPEKIDLAWSVSVSEHIAEDKVDYYLEAFNRAKYVVFTWCPKWYDGHHHVNCQDAPYWIGKFKHIGFRLDDALTDFVKMKSDLVMIKSPYWRNKSFNQKKISKMYLKQWGLCFYKYC